MTVVRCPRCKRPQTLAYFRRIDRPGRLKIEAVLSCGVKCGSIAASEFGEADRLVLRKHYLEEVA
jgi:hypothetical protein